MGQRPIAKRGRRGKERNNALVGLGVVGLIEHHQGNLARADESVGERVEEELGREDEGAAKPRRRQSGKLPKYRTRRANEAYS